MTYASRNLPATPLAGVEPPPPPTRRQFEIASFYDALSAAFGAAFGDDEPSRSDEPPMR
jgi:hypothetical protein